MLSQIRPVEISSSHRGPATVLSIDGALTAGGGDLMLRAEIEDALGCGCRQIVLDFTDLTTLDSSGLGELMRASDSVRLARALMAWCACPTSMLDVLVITNVPFDEVLFTDSLEEAVEALASLD